MSTYQHAKASTVCAMGNYSKLNIVLTIILVPGNLTFTLKGTDRMRVGKYMYGILYVYIIWQVLIKAKSSKSLFHAVLNVICW